MSHSTMGTLSPVGALSSERAVLRWPVAVIVGALALLWFEAINQLRPEWTLNPQYNYGWIVPLFAVFLFSLRWKVRPLAEAAIWKLPTIALTLAAVTMLLPARIIAIANPDWRLLSWGIVLVVTLISICLLNLAGGPAWVRHFSFPVLFFLVAVPWPTQFEQSVVQSLMRADAALTIHALNALGLIALQHGNVIELSTGMVGIDDACTGVRSLQGTLMMSLFLGEYQAMKLGGRLLLVVVGLSIAFVCNLVRTFVLCLVGDSWGIPAIHNWHDSAGLTILLVSVVCLWSLSLWLRPREPAAELAPAPWRFPSVLVAIAAAILVWIGVVEIAAGAWYGLGTGRSQVTNPWTISWPTAEPGYAVMPVPQAAQDLLRYNEGGGALWEAADAHRWAMFYFRWLPGRTAALFVKNHRPDICLPASGMTMQEDGGIQFLTVNGISMPVRSYRFSAEGQPLHIFYCYWDSRSCYQNAMTAAEEDWTAAGRLRTAWRGQRETGAQMIELAVWGFQDDEAAHQALVQQMTKIVRAAK